VTLAPSKTEENLRQAFKAFNRFMLLMWRLGLGSYGNRPELGGSIMVLTHTGRKSGLKRRTPLNYALLEGEVYCTAGFGAGADWYRNILADPQVEVWLPDGWYAGVAEDVSNDPERAFLMRQVLIGSGFAARVAGINPQKMSDEEMAPLTQSYRLVRIRLVAPRTGAGGPGDLAWVWPLATSVLLGMLLLRRRRR
jgi:deazaflavin-dependent oxidoreductase (nitroreductase family)